MKVMVQLRSSPAAHAASMATGVGEATFSAFGIASQGVILDTSFAPIQLPNVATSTSQAVRSLSQPLQFSMEVHTSTYLVRGTAPDGPSQAAALQSLSADPNVVGIFADPLIESSLVCPGAAPMGTATDVAKRLAVSKLHAAGMDGKKVYLAVVDTGINLAHLAQQGVKPKLDTGKSWTPAGVATTPGKHPVSHGTMCAFDACIAAPSATLLDYAVLLSTTPGGTAMAGLLSDAVLAYAKLRQLLVSMPLKSRAMVITNSWGMFSPTWDFPAGHPGNYSDNPNHPFNLMVASLEAEGADILFAAGNCGRDCPDGRCAFGTSTPICGANSHPAVLSVAGVDTQKDRVGYSSQGPGRLDRQKPDIAAYTHFKGSGVYPADGGTSAACPVAAGVLAAVRAKYSVGKLSPLQLRSLVKRTAEDKGHTGFDDDYGWGIIDPNALLASLP